MPLRAEPADKLRKVLATAFQSLGVDPAKAAQDPDAWIVAKGSAALQVRIVAPGEGRTMPFFQVASPVMKVPKGAAFQDKLLALNFTMGGLAAFCVTPGGEVHLVAARSGEHLSPDEAAQVIGQVAHFSDLYDDALLQEFGPQHALRADQRRSSSRAP
jgi:hypothetical protein